MNSNSLKSTAYAHLTTTSNGQMKLSNGLKMVWGSMNSSTLKADTAGMGGYYYDIDISSYGLSDSVFALAVPKYPSGIPKVGVLYVDKSTLKIGSDVGVLTNYYIFWMVIG